MRVTLELAGCPIVSAQWCGAGVRPSHRCAEDGGHLLMRNLGSSDRAQIFGDKTASMNEVSF